MDLAQLRTFLAVAEAGGISAAARARNLSQPAVSLQIKALEEDLGVVLLHRGRRGVTLTGAGEALRGHARRALDAVRAARSEAAAWGGLSRGTLSLGVTDAAATRILPPVFAAYHRRYPGIEVSVDVSATTPLLDGLRGGRFDLVLGTLPVEGTGIRTRAVWTETLGLVVPPAMRNRPLSRLLREEPFIAYPRESITRTLVDAALVRAGVPVRPVMEIGRPGVMVRLVEAGLGVSVLPESVYAPLVAAGTLVRRGGRTLAVPRSLGLVELREREPEPAARAFVEVLEEALPAL
jgi:DNA-binding transcriptional LysR family regulator